MKYMNRNTQNKSIFCKNYFVKTNYYKFATHNIRKHIAENYIWILIDEKIDKVERFANLIIGKGKRASLKY